MEEIDFGIGPVTRLVQTLGTSVLPASGDHLCAFGEYESAMRPFVEAERLISHSFTFPAVSASTLHSSSFSLLPFSFPRLLCELKSLE